MKTYKIKEIYKTIQGEGANTGRVATFVRFAGCNLWTGREEDRAIARCQVNCDTDFVGTNGINGGKYEASALVDKALEVYSEGASFESLDGVRPLVVLTGGEPMLQVDMALITELCSVFSVAIESNGTIEVKPEIRRNAWLTISPKISALLQRMGDELKLVFPQSHAAMHPSRFEKMMFDRFYLQPMEGNPVAPYRDDPELLRVARQENTRACIDYILRHPQWSLSVQTHKDVGLR